MQVRFVNRSKEFLFLENQTKKVGHSTSVVMLCGDSGVGKSELTRNFLKSKVEQFPILKVSIQQAEKNTYSSGYYIAKLAREMHDLALIDDRMFSLPDFLKTTTTTSFLKKIGDDLKSDFSELLPFSNTVKGFLDWASATGDYNTNAFFESTHSDILLTLFEYVYHECARNPLIINIENIQSIDHWSLKLLDSIVSASKNCMYLLEFTDNDQTGYTFGELVSSFEKLNVSINPLPINPLSITDVQLIIAEHPAVTWELLKNSYVNWDGNMRLLIDVLAKLKYGIPVNGHDQINIQYATEEHLKSLSSAELFLLVNIIVHQEPVEINLLKKLIVFREAAMYLFDIEPLLESLQKRTLIKINGNSIMLSHDSIQKSATNLAKYDLYAIISQRFWLQSYEQLLITDDLYSSRGWLLMKVLNFSSLLNLDNKVVDLLEIINIEVLRSRDPEKMISYIQEVRANLILKDSQKYEERIARISLWLVEIWSKLGDSKKAWDILTENSFIGKVYNVLKAILLEQIGRHTEAINFCNTELLNTLRGTNLELSLRLVRLVTNYSIGNMTEAEQEFHFLYQNKQYENLFEYGFLLRNAELIYSYQDSLPYYIESINHFLKFNAKRQAAFSRITYGVHLGLLGKYSIAKKQFKLAEDELGDEITEMHTLYNNLAVIELSQGIINGNSEELLRKALVTVTGDFDRLTIAMNYLVLMDWSGRNAEAEMAITVMEKILLKPSFASKEILRYAYYDIFKYYESTNNLKSARYYREKFNQLGLEETPIWKFWLYGNEIDEGDEDYHLSQRDRAMSFLCNWNMEYDSSLMQYE